MNGKFIPNGLTVEMMPESTAPDKLFEGVPYNPTYGHVSPERMEVMRLKVSRLRSTVKLLDAGKISLAIYENERALAVLAERFGDEVLSLTPDQALEKSIQTQHSLIRDLSEQYMKLAMILEKRQTYKQRAF